MADMSYSDAGLALTEYFEGLRLTAYQDSVGVWTIGYGHTGADVYEGLTITDDEAANLLRDDVATSVAGVNRVVTVVLTQGQFDALVDVCFNLGIGNLTKSTLLRLLNAGDYAGASGQFAVWNKAGGQVLAGLTARRTAETAMFLGQPWQ